MSSAALSTAGRFPVRRKRPNRPTVDNALRLLASTERVPVHAAHGDDPGLGVPPSCQTPIAVGMPSANSRAWDS